MKRENEGREARQVTRGSTAAAPGKLFDRQSGVARWVIIAAVLVAALAVALTLVLTRGASRNTIAGHPVPAPTIDPVSSSGTAPKPGELVITLPPEQIENAKFETAVVTAVSGPETGGAGLRTAGVVQSNAYKETAVFPVVTGIVRQVNAEIGDRVSRGQLLATVFSNELAEAQAAGSARGEAEAAERIGRAIADVDAYFAGLSSELADLVFTVVRDVVDQFDRRDIVAMAALKALTAFRRSRTLTVRVHPDHVETVNETLQEAVRTGGVEIALEVSGDPTMARGGCVLTSDIATVDAGIDSQIEALRRGLLRRMMPA